MGSWCWLELDKCHYSTGEKTQEGVPRCPRESGALAAGMTHAVRMCFSPRLGVIRNRL